MRKMLPLALVLLFWALSANAQILYPFDFEDETLNERIGYNPSPTRLLPLGALLDSMQYGELDGSDWEDDEVIKITRTPDFEILSQSWSNQFGDYATDTARFLLSGAADSFWIVREESYFDFNTNQRDTFTSARIGKRWYENGRLDSVRLVGTYESSNNPTSGDEITHSFTYGQFGLTSFSVLYTEPSYSYVERTDVAYNASGEKSGYQVFEVDGMDEELEIDATITRLSSSQIRYEIDDYGDVVVVDQYLSQAGNIDSISYSFVDGADTFMVTLARTDDGTDLRFFEYAFISGSIDDPERLRYWLSDPVSGVDQLPMVAGKLQSSNPIRAGNKVRLNELRPGTQISVVDVNGRVINTQTSSSKEVSFDWPPVTGGIYFIVAQLPGHATRAWELVGI